MSAPGLRVEPASDLSSIDHADLWLDPGSGVPLRVEVYADGVGHRRLHQRVPGLLERPAGRAAVRFDPPAGVDVDFDDVLDIADAANQYAPVRPPDTVAGLPKAAASDRAVGVYGTGMTEVIAIPLRDREADALRDQLADHRGVDQDDRRTVVSVGPLGVVLTGAEGDGGWLLAGTLTRAALVQAADDVLAGFVYVDDRRMSDQRPAVIRTEGLTKRFGPITAVDGIDLDVREGDVYGFLGANGSGKTTTVRMLLGLVLATSGRMEVLGQEMPGAARKVLPQVGALVEGPAAYPHLSGRRNLRALRRDGAGRRPGHPPRPGRRRARAGRARRRGRAPGPRVLPGHAAAARPGRCPAARARGCWCSTSRPTASTRRASRRSASCCSTSTGPGPRSSSPATCWARSSSSAPGSASSTAAGWSCRRELAELRRPTGRVEVHTP